MKLINIVSKHVTFTKEWHPHQITFVDTIQMLIAKLKGEFVWHVHENEDEFLGDKRHFLYAT